MQRVGFLLALLAVAGERLVAETISLPVVKDNSIVMVEGEWGENAGQKGQMRIKGNQHIVAMAFDLSAIRGKEVTKGTLVCFQGEQLIAAVTLSTIAVPWEESRSNGLTAGVGDVAGWGYPGARFPAVCGGNGFTLTHQATSVVRDGKYHWDISPDMIHAMAIGVAHGLAIHEHDADYRRNPTIFSREQSAKKPVLLVEVRDASDKAVEPASDLKIVSSDATSAKLSLTAPASGFAYEVLVNGQRVGTHNVPLVASGQNQVIELRDLPTSVMSNDQHEVQVTTLSRLGGRSKPALLRGSVFRKAGISTPPKVASTKPSSKPTSGLQGVAVIPVLDKYDQAGKPIGDLPEDYRRSNSIFDGSGVKLTAAAGEVVGFQLLVRGNSDAQVTLELSELKWRVDLYEAQYVPSQGRMIPDPLLPLAKSIALKPNEDAVIVADVFVPFDARAGVRTGHITISDGRSIPVRINVLPYAIPKQATFFCEMNGYGLPDHVNEYDAVQRVAYDHRVHANILHYSHNTAAAGARKSNTDMRLRSGRRMDNKRYDSVVPGDTTAFWDDFVEAFGPHLDGSLFSDGHRGPIPSPGFYLTFHESWPLNCRPFFNGDPDAFKAFTGRPEYSQTYVNIMQDFAKLARSKGWTQTAFQVYFNNKGSLTETTKAPWILDEPASFWDYRALKYYGELTDRGRAAAPEMKINYRIDISRPEFARGQLDGRRDLWIVATSAFQNYRRLVTDRIDRDQLTAWVYGSSNHVHESNRNIQAWALDAWQDGATGIVPWQTINKTGSALKQADQLGLFIFDKDASGATVIRHSLRLKAFREAQQLIEHLNLLRQKSGWSDTQTRDFLQQHITLNAAVQKTNDDDAGTTSYGRLTADSLDSLRQATTELLSSPQ